MSAKETEAVRCTSMNNMQAMEARAALYIKCLEFAQMEQQGIISLDEALEGATNAVPTELIRWTQGNERQAGGLLYATEDESLRPEKYEELIKKMPRIYGKLYEHTAFVFCHALFSACVRDGVRGYIHDNAGRRAALQVEEWLVQSIAIGHYTNALVYTDFYYQDYFSLLLEYGTVLEDYYMLTAAYALHGAAAQGQRFGDWWIHYEFAQYKVREYLPFARSQYAGDKAKQAKLTGYANRVGL